MESKEDKKDPAEGMTAEQIREKLEKLKNELNTKTHEEKIAFKKNKKQREIKKIKDIFEKICEKNQKNMKFEDEYQKYRKDPKSFEERKMVIITRAMVDLFADNEEDEEKNKKKKMKLIKSEIEKKYEEEKAKEKENTNYKPPKVKLNIDSPIKDVLCEALRYDKYMEDPNYCSDYTPDDISDSDVSDVDTKSVIEEVSKNMELLTKASQCEKAEDKNQEFNEKLLNQYVKNAQEAKAFYYKEKLHIDINTEQGKEEKNPKYSS